MSLNFVNIEIWTGGREAKPRRCHRTEMREAHFSLRLIIIGFGNRDELLMTFFTMTKRQKEHRDSVIILSLLC